MLYLLALLPALASLAAASPIAKRYSAQWIVSGNTGLCLTLPAGTTPGNGALLVDGACNSGTTVWDINPGSGSVVISGTNFALDAGSNPANGVQAKVWTSYPGLSQQTWFLTGDNRIAITGGTQCLDVGLPNPGYPQTWQCSPGNTNQVWNIVAPGGTPSSSASSTATPTSMPSSSASSTSASMTTSSMPPHPTTTLRTQRQLQWGGPGNGCLTVQGGQAYNGVPVNIAPCQFPDDNGARPQWFNYMDGGAIQWFGNTAYCLDAGSNPSNGGQMKLWQCYAGLPQQTWAFGSGTLFSTANNQCLDVNNSGNNMLQTWTCSASDPQQQFYIV